ncbi:MAG TPA: FG-GAP-like repeat-containing protein [Tepidisphaeraceae bacterium]|jgi:hypothetical protein
MSDERIEAAAPNRLAQLFEIDDPLARGARVTPTVSGYRLIREISRGGQGVVFLAIQESTTRKVAVKFLKDGPLAPEGERLRLGREVQALAALEHPNIVSVIDSGVTSEGWHYLVTDFVEGLAVDEYVEQQALSLERKVALVAKIAGAVSAAHVRGIMHRDLKPSNIVVDEAGEPHLLDFGLARAGMSKRDATMTGEFVGSLHYASPEQAGGNPSAIDLRTDVYSLGVILYELVAGQHPYEVTGSVEKALRNIVRGTPRALPAGTPGELTRIIGKAMSKRAADRYQSAGELARELERLCVEGVRVGEGRVSKRLLAVAVAVSLALVASAVAALWRNSTRSGVAAEAPPAAVAVQPSPTTVAAGEEGKGGLLRFSPPIKSLATISPWAAVGDFDGDGKADLAVGAFKNSVISFGTGDGSFINQKFYDLAGDIAAADLNGDGRLDIVGSVNNAPCKALLFQAGGGFEVRATGASPGRVTPMDFNRDGKTDLIVMSNGTHPPEMSIYAGDGKGNFELQGKFPLPAESWRAAVGDFNGDGWVDVLPIFAHDRLTGTWYAATRGAPWFRPAGQYPGRDHNQVAAADVDGDGRTDLVNRRNGERKLHILLAPRKVLRGQANFEAAAVLNLPALKEKPKTSRGEPMRINLVDMDGDKKLDIVAATDESPAVYIFLGKGRGAFGPAMEFDTGVATSVWGQAIADVNGDGRPDIVSTDTGNPYATTLLNEPE